MLSSITGIGEGTTQLPALSCGRKIKL